MLVMSEGLVGEEKGWPVCPVSLWKNYIEEIEYRIDVQSIPKHLSCSIGAAKAKYPFILKRECTFSIQTHTPRHTQGETEG